LAQDRNTAVIGLQRDLSNGYLCVFGASFSLRYRGKGGIVAAFNLSAGIHPSRPEE
jgi:hypothetical protein